jgi:hypothetical protein
VACSRTLIPKTKTNIQQATPETRTSDGERRDDGAAEARSGPVCFTNFVWKIALRRTTCCNCCGAARGIGAVGYLVNRINQAASSLAAPSSQWSPPPCRLLLGVAMVPALSLIFTAAIERTVGARDEANRDRQAIASGSI